MLFALAPTTVIVWTAVIGVCAGIFGARRWAIYLITPAVLTFIIWPLVKPFATSAADAALDHWWLFAPLMLVAPIVLIVLGLRLVISIIENLFGRRVAGHVGGVYVVRLLDFALGRRRGQAIPELDDVDHH